MASETALINRALVRIGSKRITSVNEDSPQAQAVRDVWDDVRQSFLRSHPWNFATFRDKLALSVTTSISPRNTFGKPGPTQSRGVWLRTVQISLDSAYQYDASYRDAGGFIRSDSPQLYSRTIHDITDIDRFEPLAREALMYKLTCELCITLANSLDQLQAFTTLYDKALEEARKVDVRDEVPTQIPILDRALAMIGMQRLSSLDEDGPQPQVIRDVYDDVRTSLLRAHPWNFATFRSDLDLIDTTEISPRNTFSKPGTVFSDDGSLARGRWLRTLQVSEDPEFKIDASYRDRGAGILSDAETLYMRSIHDVVEEQLWDSLFREALTHKLASQLAITFAKPAEVHQLLEQRFERLLQQARKVDTYDEVPTRILVLDRALALLGNQQLYSMEKEGPQANVIRDIYKQMRQSLLRSHAWNFAIRRSQLEQIDETTIAPKYTFNKPPALFDEDGNQIRGVWLRTVEICVDDQFEEPAVYQDRGTAILSDSPTLFIRAVHDYDDEDLLDPMFQEVLTLKLAMHLAAPLGKPVGWNQLMEARYEKALAQARSVDATDETAPRIPIDTWELGRFENAGGRFRIDSVYDI